MTTKAIKGTVAKLLTAGVLAGAVALAFPAKASAQEVVVFGNQPHPILARYDRFRRFEYDRFRAEQFRRREEWRRDHFEHRYYR